MVKLVQRFLLIDSVIHNYNGTFITASNNKQNAFMSDVARIHVKSCSVEKGLRPDTNPSVDHVGIWDI